MGHLAVPSGSGDLFPHNLCERDSLNRFRATDSAISSAICQDDELASRGEGLIKYLDVDPCSAAVANDIPKFEIPKQDGRVTGVD